MERQEDFGNGNDHEFSGNENTDNQQNRREGGYGNNNYRQNNNYGNRPRYNNNRNNGEGGYQQRPRYNNNGEGGYQQRPRYNNNGEGGYQQRPRYNNNGEGGYQQRPRNNNFNGRGNNKPQMNKKAKKKIDKEAAEYRKKIEFTNDWFVEKDNEKDFVVANSTNNPSTKMRLNRFIAMAGVCSRREADELIVKGEIKVNGEVVKELGVVLKIGDKVEYQGRQLKAEKLFYVLLNKPKDTVTTTDDPECRRTVMDLVADACEERIYPVGRLDRNTTGVLLLTNDGELTEHLTHPRYGVRKIYHVCLDKNVSENDMQQLLAGIVLEDKNGETFKMSVDDVQYVDPNDHKQVGVQIHSGKNRIVRRLFEHLGYEVEKLDRVYFAGLTKVNVPRGRWRFLEEPEINKLKAGFFK